MQVLKVVRYIDGHLVMRPSDQYDAERWMELKDRVRGIRPGCATCWRPGEELHHRHYDNFGSETLDDVTLLCGECHRYITSRIRKARWDLGDRTIMDGAAPEETLERARPQPTRGSPPQCAAEPEQRRSRPAPTTTRG